MPDAKINPWIAAINPAPPSLENNTADAERLISALNTEVDDIPISIDYLLLKKLPHILNNNPGQIDCLFFPEKGGITIIGLAEPRAVGCAVDIGTTRVVMRLVDLKTSDTLAETAFDNPQAAIGPDVLARVHFSETPGGLEKLNSLIINALNDNLAKLCKSAYITPEDVFIVSAAGNTAMTHLFLGLPSRSLIREPYIPAINTPGVFTSINLGIDINPSARVYVFPNIGSYFGGDLAAGIIFSEIYDAKKTSILVDVGTNAEVVLGNRDWLIACAGAAGPALEGGVTEMGMTAGPGVIDRVKIQNGLVNFQTIEGLPAVGICGSGLIDLAAALFLNGFLDIRGRLVKEKCGNRYAETDGMGCFVLLPESESTTSSAIAITQADINSLIRSKAAMYTILKTICATVGIDVSDIMEFFVAGTFGSFIDPESAISIGMLPDLPRERYVPMGNTSLEGAILLLTNKNIMEKAEEITKRITYLELNVNQEFMNRFSAAKFLPHTDPEEFPSVK